MGGHAEALLMTSPASVRLLGLDVDPEAVRRAGLRLARFGDRVRLARASFANLGSAAEAHGVGRAHAILLDLGVSSHQLETSGRGFSFQRDEPLDMRLDPERGETAADLVNRRPEAELEPSPLGPETDEVRANPRARSARLRVLERLS